MSKGPKTFTKNYALDISVAIVSNNYFGTPYGCVFGLVFRGEEKGVSKCPANEAAKRVVVSTYFCLCPLVSNLVMESCRYIPETRVFVMH